MKTTVDIPTFLLRRAKFVAAEQGISLQEFVLEATREKLSRGGRIEGKPWMAAFGKLRRLKQESARIDCLIEQEFERIEPER